jgi:hypothetical protein
MTISFPLSLDTFADQYKVVDCSLVLGWQQESSGAGSGQVLYADRAPPQWAGTITLGDLPLATAEAAHALLNALAGGLNTLLLYNFRGGKYPSSDPDGSLFGSATPVVGTVADAFHSTFTGFPAGYVIPAGTYVQIIYSTSHYYLGQFAEAVTADGSGNVASVRLAPALPASIAGGEAVTVIKPSALFRVTPGSIKPTLTTSLTERLSFDVKQAL